MSDYDLETAEAMLATKRFLYVGFMCHQTIEKILKAYWSGCLTEPPLKIHSLSRLAEKTGLDKEFFVRSVASIRDTSAEDIRRLAQKYFCKENLIEVVAGKKV